ncbi:chorismate-binding protein [Olleya sp. YSTF-M6]|uniref:Chorismate-binding protein n=1 Tax=Olleya sediminilitoris TaxID=2795739 RepID=A0ABS1WIC3_9FLAO|nr:chorismate-binding protein [Olleya sediminilitoris]MBL7558803.1 chorismate-binding protein [Olleya sediminilitoris]
MTTLDFFEHLNIHFNNDLPFVAYRKPNDGVVKAMLQDDAKLHYTTNFKASGFVFSPFQNKNENILFPLENCKTLKTSFKIEDKTITSNSAFSVSETSKQKHLDLVEKAIAEINTNTFKKVVVSRVEAQDFSKTETLSLLQKLLNTYTTAMVYCWYHPKVGLWLGATPETLLKVEGNRFLTMSLAGTQPYIDTEEVIWQAKEKEEQQLVTNFIVDSLQDNVNTLNVGQTETIKAGKLLHLRTKISGLLDPEKGLVSVIKQLHPTPAVCGLPKQNAQQFIINNEGYNREFYTGFLGEINLKQSKTRNTNRRNVENNAYATVKSVSHVFVNLRCLQIKDNQALIYVGGGITKDSIPENEWDETVAKSKTVKNLL